MEFYGLGRGPIFGTSANSKAPLLSSNASHFIMFVASFDSIAAIIFFNRRTIGIVSRKEVDNTTCSASSVDVTIYILSFDFHIIGQLEYFITHPVQECTKARSEAAVYQILQQSLRLQAFIWCKCQNFHPPH